MYEAEQLLEFSHVGDGPSEGLSVDEVGAALSDPLEVVWVWKDWPRSHFEKVVEPGGYVSSGGLAALDNGDHVELMTGGRSGLPSVIFATRDPEMFLEAQPFQKQELVGRLHEFDGLHYFDQVAPLEDFSIQVEPD